MFVEHKIFLYVYDCVMENFHFLLFSVYKPLYYGSQLHSQFSLMCLCLIFIKTGTVKYKIRISLSTILCGSSCTFIKVKCTHYYQMSWWECVRWVYCWCYSFVLVCLFLVHMHSFRLFMVTIVTLIIKGFIGISTNLNSIYRYFIFCEQRILSVAMWWEIILFSLKGH